jgi:hypothetical protein
VRNKKKYAVLTCTLFYAVYTLFIYGAFSAEKMTNEQGQFSFTVPNGFVTEQLSEGRGVTLTSASTLSSFVPKISMREVSQEEALEAYGEVMNRIQSERQRRRPRMRLLKKQSILNSNQIPGWELSYLNHEDALSSKDIPVARYFILLDYENGRMLQINGIAPFEARSEFGLLCDRLVNSVNVLSDQ